MLSSAPSLFMTAIGGCHAGPPGEASWVAWYLQNRLQTGGLPAGVDCKQFPCGATPMLPAWDPLIMS
jgi:hypothetical protein